MTKLFVIAITLAVLAAPAIAQSPKKGFGVVVRGGGRWKREVNALKVPWFYSWGGDEPSDMPAGMEFVPMDWGYYGNKDDKLTKWLAKVKAQPGIDTLLGFNEPDNKTQANLSVDAALEGWPYLMQTGLALGSPAPVHADDAWMQAFMQGAREKHYRVDFICVHWYGGPDPQSFLGYLARIHDLYHLPIWVTEFAPADWHAGPGHPSSVTVQQTEDFMQAVLPAMDKVDYVQRYAWFSGSPGDGPLGSAALFNHDGTLTDLGQLYASH
ncbi:MAG TPA: glycoside hydrolase family protein [Capsulimonadaceae bacterium]|nr:glycoside hydrolase family protein [Capsulimonadaceae bacterium]